MDLIAKNAEITERIIPNVVKNAPDAFIFLTTNPVDVLTYIAYKNLDFLPERVIGSGTLLDSVRLIYNLGQYFGGASTSNNAFIVGEQGDSEVSTWSLASIACMQLCDFCKEFDRKFDKNTLHKIYEETRGAAENIIQRKDYTAYGITAGLTHIVKATLRDEGSLLSVPTVGECFGEKYVAHSIPTKVVRG